MLLELGRDGGSINNHPSKLWTVAAHSPVEKRWNELTPRELYAFLKLRTDVFLVEQGVDETELDWRDAEPETLHYWIESPADDGSTELAAYLRVLYDDRAEHGDAHRVIGRVVVHPAHRGEGLAQSLLGRVLERFGTEPMLLHAQSYIAPLYARVGFEPFGDEYLEAGIPHISMLRKGTGRPGAALGGR